jgi:hypothetical protein
MKNLAAVGVAMVMVLTLVGCLATEQDVLEETGAGLAAPQCIADDGTTTADADECVGSARCCMEDDAGGRYCKGGGDVDTEAECLAAGGIKYYGSTGECDRKCPGAEPMPVD